jgi:hypothetical protein
MPLGIQRSFQSHCKIIKLIKSHARAFHNNSGGKVFSQ